ncbi:thioredoxin domain-containing protein [Streptomyces sp. C10-9-1]|uniref:DsbA family protein n=1 Tax=Streptomyces sp. C10-9-1 TaxID=1859285 RepID=UPI002110EB21|nr:thioredoxin domain-containing protein [Streptomyces sp. C10-9-1]MCQ6556016.1 thioredoxin domain-containing protein [Streptomyces sp. C10-9-1]
MPSDRPSAPSRAPLAIGAGVLAAAVLLGWASYTATKPEGSGAGTSAASAAESRPRSALESVARRDADDPLAVGRHDAPVVLVEYADFQCGYCGVFARDTEPELVRRYVEDGTLRIEFRNFPIFGEESEAAARAAWAAGRQGRFWEFHAAAYAEDAAGEGFTADRLRALAEEAGVADLDRFARDMHGDRARGAVARDRAEGYKLGVASTPSFLVNGYPVSGAQPLAVFADEVEEAARAAKDRG